MWPVFKKTSREYTLIGPILWKPERALQIQVHDKAGRESQSGNGSIKRGYTGTRVCGYSGLEGYFVRILHEF